eukprot:CAMPEP_0119131798 /NCGR_PEP_ID=MMETSP1310-20130426/10614_1 /TAXON_ID=464262 /ORGANISM="Genus nov. species nov., Strain RCC2339" /LENGTH=42 /DNA_ID= /DNA_START= /DNA_END= /DNA_ORIENTATION=
MESMVLCSTILVSSSSCWIFSSLSACEGSWNLAIASWHTASP